MRRYSLFFSTVTLLALCVFALEARCFAGAADIKDAENSSIEHSKTELQRFDEKRPEIKVHAITDDFHLRNSEKAD